MAFYTSHPPDIVYSAGDPEINVFSDSSNCRRTLCPFSPLADRCWIKSSGYTADVCAIPDPNLVEALILASIRTARWNLTRSRSLPSRNLKLLVISSCSSVPGVSTIDHDASVASDRPPWIASQAVDPNCDAMVWTDCWQLSVVPWTNTFYRYARITSK